MKAARVSNKTNTYGVTGSGCSLVKVLYVHLLEMPKGTVKILVSVVFRKDVCLTSTDTCELWMTLGIMRFEVLTAVLLKPNL
jgi:hypothetical protein